ncbi:MAG: sigma-70 family RNA polymerase sigma factor [Chloroflexi bacterium]|nr:sigma-70 family RNA polymerase sigma factor [Chloroflexota bacterium]
MSVVSQMATPSRPQDPRESPSAGTVTATAALEPSLRTHPEARSDVLRVYESHKGELLAFLVTATRDGELAADLLQESFVRLLRESLVRGLPLEPRAWLFRVAGNLAVSAARRRAVVRRWAPWLARHDDEGSAEQEYLRREDADAVHTALAGLRGDDRIALLMAAHGCTIPEISRAVRRTELATRSLLCRARIRLRDQAQRQEKNR